LISARPRAGEASGFPAALRPGTTPGWAAAADRSVLCVFGLVPATTPFGPLLQAGVDARHKAGHDAERGAKPCPTRPPSPNVGRVGRRPGWGEPHGRETPGRFRRAQRSQIGPPHPAVSLREPSTPPLAGRVSARSQRRMPVAKDDARGRGGHARRPTTFVSLKDLAQARTAKPQAGAPGSPTAPCAENERILGRQNRSRGPEPDGADIRP